jgi:WD40 repeat protein/tetratricopeptide (TPR) repeat protein
MSDTLSVSVQLYLEEACARFEGAWQAAGAEGDPPRVGDYVGDTTQPGAGPLLRELVLLDLHYRRRRGERPGADDYAACCPSLDRAWLAEACAPGVSPSTIESVRTTPERFTPPAPALPVVLGYEVLGELGHGGMGMVYQARQVAADRIVALKMILSGALARPEERDRFRTEARAVARLNHPHIVQVYDVGEREGCSFFSMEYVAGSSLDKRLRISLPEPREAARLVEMLARAIEAVHEAGVIHRDLKPANVLLAPSDRPGAVRVAAEAGEAGMFEPKVTDFGLAKWQGEDPKLTGTGQAMGTPSYMAPEQASGGTALATALADVYSLGAILYECLAGRPPFRAATVAQTLRQVVEEEPVPPRALNPAVPRDLETICLKCLRKEPAKRYESALALADDLRRWLHGEPILARPVGRLEKLARWCYRHPVPTAAAAIILATVATAFAIVMYSRDQAIDAKNGAFKLAEEKTALAGQYAELAEKHEKTANEKTALANEKEALAHKEREQRLLVERAAANSSLRDGQDSCDRGDVGRGILYMAHAIDLAHEAKADDVEQAARTQLALWRTRWPAVSMVLPHAGDVLAVAFSADGRTLLTGGADKKARRWDAATGQPAGEPVDLAMDPARPMPGRLPPGVGPFADPLLLGNLPGRGPDGGPKYAGEVVAVALSPDGRALAVGTGDPSYRGRSQLVEPGDRLRLDTGLGRLGDRLAPFGGPNLRDPRFGRDQMMERMMMGTAAPLWDAATGKPLHPQAWRQPTWAVAFSPDGRTLVTGGGKYQKRDGIDDFGRPRGFGGFGYNSMDPLGRGDQQAVSEQAHLWDVAKGQHLRSLPHDNAVLAVAFSPDGRRVLTGCADAAARLWDAHTGRQLGKAISLEGPVVAVAFSPDGRLFLTGSQTSATSGAVQLWAVDTGQAVTQPLQHQYPVLAAAFSPDGRHVLTGSGDPLSGKGEAHLWALGARGLGGQPLPHPGPVHAVAWSPDGRWIVTGCADGLARVWQAIPVPPVVMLRHHQNVLAYSPDGCRAVLGSRVSADRQQCEELSLGGTAPAQPPVRLSQESREPGPAAFTPDSSRVVINFSNRKVSSDGRNELRLVDAVGGRLIGKPVSPDGSLEALALSPDGRTLVTGTSQPYQNRGEAILWDAVTGELLRKFSFEAPVLGVAFSPDGRTLAAGSGMPQAARGEVRLWDVETGELRRTLSHPAAVRVVLFSPDGHTLATAGDDPAARLWDVANGELRGAPLAHRARVRALAFSADGGRLLTGSDDQTAQLWEVATGRRVGAALPHQGAVRAVAVSGDGRLLLTGSDDHAARLWEAATGRPLDEPLPHEGPVVGAAFGADGRTFLTRSTPTNTTVRRIVGHTWETTFGKGWDSAGRVWALPGPVGDDPASVWLWAQVFTGLTLDQDGRARPLDAAGWREQRERLGERGDPSPSAEALREWHRREARAADAAAQWFAAAWHLGRLEDDEPASEDLHARRGRAYVLAGRPREAVDELTPVVASQPRRVDVWNLRGMAYAALNQDDKAVADFSKAIEQETIMRHAGRPTNGAWALWFHRGEAHFRLSQMDKAAEDLSEVLKMTPDHAPSWHARGLARAELGKPEQAADDFAAALQRPNPPARTWLDLPLAHLARGDARAYRDACAQAVTHFGQPEDPALALQLAWTCSLGPGAEADPEAAVRRARQAFDQDPQSYIHARTLGAALYRAGKFQDAVNVLTRATQLRKQPAPSAWLFLALAHARLQHAEEAKKWLGMAREWVDQAQRQKPGEAGDESALSWHKLPWNERLAVTVLQREAEALVAGTAPAPPK